MKRFSASLAIISLCLVSSCSATKHVRRVPHLKIIAPVILSVEEVPIFEDSKAVFINSLVKQVWDENFGKFTEFFCRHFFQSTHTGKRELDTVVVTENTVLEAEKLMRYLHGASTKSCLDLFKSWVEFYKNFRCDAIRKGLIFESFKKFVSRFLLEISKNFYITNELLREQTEIMCELYELEDKKTLSLL